MAKFAHNSTENTSISYTLFELNCEYYPKVLFEDETDLGSRSRFPQKIVEELRELMEICY